jgi:tRNA (guanine-N7-)-methyltransferase
MFTIDSVIIPPPTDGEILDPDTWFDTPGPFEIEIGCGKGGFLLARARTNPDARLLGIEWASKYYKHCADRMVRRGLTNVRVMRTDARYLVQNHLPPDSVSVLHLYHPDPWPKKRHHKRRLVQPAFAAAVARILKPGGRWYIQTDHEEYFEWIRDVVSREPGLEPVPWDDTPRPNDPEWSGTNFEVKYTKQGRPIHRIACARPSEPQ